MPIKSKPSPSPEEIAAMATRGEDVSRFFTNEFKVNQPVHSLNVDPTPDPNEKPAQKPPARNVHRRPGRSQIS